MSHVRMCDNCAELFSVNEGGWQEYTRRVKEDPNHPYNHGLEVLHMCSKCAGSPIARKPRLAIEDSHPKGE